MSSWVGVSFIASSILAIFLIRDVMAPVDVADVPAPDAA
jgi:hypothetical protein